MLILPFILFSGRSWAFFLSLLAIGHHCVAKFGHIGTLCEIVLQPLGVTGVCVVGVWWGWNGAIANANWYILTIYCSVEMADESGYEGWVARVVVEVAVRRDVGSPCSLALVRPTTMPPSQ
jgi:hypothetical protein